MRLPLILVVVLATNVFATEPYFKPLGFMPNGSYSQAHGVSGDGSTVVGYANSAAGFECAFRWTLESGLESLGDFYPDDGVVSVAHTVSRDGTRIAGAAMKKNGAIHAFLWTNEHGFRDLGDLPGGDDYSHAYGISGDGATVIGVSSSKRTPPGYAEAMRWNASDGMKDLGDWPRDENEQDQIPWSHVVRDVSDDGTRIVGDASNHAVLWTAEGGFEKLGFMKNGRWANALGISGDGNVVVGRGELGDGKQTNDGAFCWTRESGMQFLGNIPGDKKGYSIAIDANADGSIIVGSGSNGRNGGDYVTPLIWDAEHGSRDLEKVLKEEFGFDLGGMKLQIAFGVSDDGRTIVGSGYNKNGDPEGWVAHIPEPSTAALALSLLVLIRRSRAIRSGFVRGVARVADPISSYGPLTR